jgi:hypothetical protein
MRSRNGEQDLDELDDDQKSNCTLNRMNRDRSTAVGVIHFAPFVAGS